MDDKKNALVSSKRRSQYAVFSASVAALTLGFIVLSSAAYSQGYARAAQYLAYGQLLFPVGIVAGHLARRQLLRNPSTYSGAGWAAVGLAVGYLNLIIVVLILVMAMAGARN